MISNTSSFRVRIPPFRVYKSQVQTKQEPDIQFGHDLFQYVAIQWSSGFIFRSYWKGSSFWRRRRKKKFIRIPPCLTMAAELWSIIIITITVIIISLRVFDLQQFLPHRILPLWARRIITSGSTVPCRPLWLVIILISKRSELPIAVSLIRRNNRNRLGNPFHKRLNHPQTGKRNNNIFSASLFIYCW